MNTSVKPLPTALMWLLVLGFSAPAGWVATPSVDAVAVAGCFFTMILSWMYLRIYGRWAPPVVATLLFAVACFESAHLSIFETYWLLSCALSILVKLVGVSLMLFVGPRAKSYYARSVLFSLALEGALVMYISMFPQPLDFKGFHLEQVFVWAESFVMFGGLSLDMTALILEMRANRFSGPRPADAAAAPEAPAKNLFLVKTNRQP
jgi:hypothetical protein